MLWVVFEKLCARQRSLYCVSAAWFILTVRWHIFHSRYSLESLFFLKMTFRERRNEREGFTLTPFPSPLLTNWWELFHAHTLNISFHSSEMKPWKYYARNIEVRAAESNQQLQPASRPLCRPALCDLLFQLGNKQPACLCMAVYCESATFRDISALKMEWE